MYNAITAKSLQEPEIVEHCDDNQDIVVVGHRLDVEAKERKHNMLLMRHDSDIMAGH